MKAVTKKKKAPRVVGTRSLDKKTMGDEPVYEAGKELSRMDVVHSYNWYNYFVESSTGYKYLQTYLKDHDTKLLSKVKKLTDKEIVSTTFWIARLLSLGYVLPDSSKEYMRTKINEAFTKKLMKKDEEPNDTVKPVLRIQDKMKAKYDDFIGSIEEMIDRGNVVENYYNHLQTFDIPFQKLSDVVAYYEPVRDEIREVMRRGSDQDLREGYSLYTRDELKNILNKYETIVEDTNKFINNKKNVKKTQTRKKRSVSIEKKLKNIRYKKEDAEYKITSVNPSGIIGASEVWLFNARYREVRVIKTSSLSGLDIKGASIINVDEKTSFARKTGNRSHDIIQEILSCNKAALKKVLDKVNTKINNATPRFTDDVLILRVL